ncbi:MAG: DUF1638 domain-containing protein [Desulfobacterales bacterium]|nr:DUF1638 domain-containing protein [Desulfobacterales bacterium]MBL7225743.1 DUF1638 domain-containing protein [Desulfobacteraceae bacterium]
MTSGIGQSNAKKEERSNVIVACRVMQPELECIRDGNSGVDIRYIDQGLHRTPDKMAALVQEQVDEAAPCAKRIVLGYGLCSNGIVGVVARQQGLLVPRSHDCIALFMGSLSAYKKAFEKRPGTYYLTPGWIQEGKDPLGIVEDDYMRRFDRETSMWVMKEELKHYTHIALINTGLAEQRGLRERAMENARVFKKEYEEIKGSLEYFSKIIRGPYTDQFFLNINPYDAVTQEMFFE